MKNNLLFILAVLSLSRVSAQKVEFYSGWDEWKVHKIEGNYIDGKKNGLWIESRANGKLESQGEYIDGKKTGYWEEWRYDYQETNASLKNYGKYVNGNRDSIWISVTLEGEKTGKEKYLKDTTTGHITYKSWYANNRKREHGEYDGKWLEFFPNGHKIGEWIEWHANGRVKSKATYINGMVNGEYVSWHKNGRMNSSTTYVNGKIEGDVKIWHGNGKIHSIMQYKNGKLDGNYISYFSNGNKENEKVYKNGKMIKQIIYNYDGTGEVLSTWEDKE